MFESSTKLGHNYFTLLDDSSITKGLQQKIKGLVKPELLKVHTTLSL